MFQQQIKEVLSNPKKVNLIVFLLICIITIVLHYPYINTFPSFIHAWAQADRYALAIGFIRNGFDFFRPETFVLNHQFPHSFLVQNEYSITAVDFPIHDYIVGLAMHIIRPELGANFAGAMPWVFRTYTLLFSLIGLFYFFKLALLVTHSKFKSLIALMFFMTSPVFVFYQSGFLPTIPSLSLTIIALFQYLKYRGFGIKSTVNQEKSTSFLIKKDVENTSQKYFTYSVLLLTFASLSRTTFAIPLVALISIEVFRYLRFKKFKKVKKSSFFPVVLILLSIGSILGFAYHNKLLREEFGSIFLAEFMLASSWQEAKEIILVSYDNWFKQYFSTSHHLIIIAISSLTVFASLYLKKQFTIQLKQFLFLTLIITLGCVLFSALMLKQFIAHDYYFLDSFFLPSGLAVIFILAFFPNASDISKISFNKSLMVHGLILLAITAPLMIRAHENQKDRRFVHSYDINHVMVTNFQNSAQFLTDLGVPQDAKILVISCLAPNIPFVFLNRKGYIILTSDKDRIKNTLDWDYDYIVFQNEVFTSKIQPNFPSLINHLTKVGDNGKISVCKYNKTL